MPVPRFKGSRIALFVETSNAESPTIMIYITSQLWLYVYIHPTGRPLLLCSWQTVWICEILESSKPKRTVTPFYVNVRPPPLPAGLRQGWAIAKVRIISDYTKEKEGFFNPSPTLRRKYIRPNLKRAGIRWPIKQGMTSKIRRRNGTRNRFPVAVVLQVATKIYCDGRCSTTALKKAIGCNGQRMLVRWLLHAGVLANATACIGIRTMVQNLGKYGREKEECLLYEVSRPQWRGVVPFKLTTAHTKKKVENNST